MLAYVCHYCVYSSAHSEFLCLLHRTLTICTAGSKKASKPVAVPVAAAAPAQAAAAPASAAAAAAAAAGIAPAN
jgi:hypothetical protein